MAPKARTSRTTTESPDVPLRTSWRPLERATIATAPARPGVYELGIGGDVVAVETGVIRDGIKSALVYADADQVRWTETHTLEAATEVAVEHRERAGLD